LAGCRPHKLSCIATDVTTHVYEACNLLAWSWLCAIHPTLNPSVPHWYVSSASATFFVLLGAAPLPLSRSPSRMLECMPNALLPLLLASLSEWNIFNPSVSKHSVTLDASHSQKPLNNLLMTGHSGHSHPRKPLVAATAVTLCTRSYACC
jgi:hypothetical protein